MELPKRGRCGVADIAVPATDRLLHARVVIIPHHVITIEAGQRAIEWERRYGPLAMISIRAEHSEHNLFDGCLASITQPIIFEANVACRLLLDFLGLGTVGATPPMLRPIRQRRRTDIGIEHYRKRDGSPLEKLDLLKLSERYGDNVLSSWASVIAIVNKRLSHLTDDSSARGVEADRAIEATFAAVPDLVRQEFLEKL
ncbi:MAG: hypothetical protein ACYCVY_10235 [Acidiferrobacteraceae bacterium]